MRRYLAGISTAALIAALPATVHAVPYASALSDDGTNASFVLNQAADLVEVSLDGGAFSSLGALTAGSHSVVLGGATSYNFRVTHSEVDGWTQYSDDDKIDNAFFRATGLAVNKDPSSSNFGTIYVVNPGAGGAVIDPLIPLSRDTDMGIYALSADSTTLVAPSPFSTNQGGIDWSLSTTASPFKANVAPDGQVYIASWADAAAGVHRAPADLSGTWTQVLANDNPNADGSGLHDNHGSVRAILVEGTGAGTELFTMDEDLNREENAAAPGTYWTAGDVNRYDIGANATPYAAAPTIVTADDGVNPAFLPGGNIVNGSTDMAHDEDGSWWVSQFRFTDGVSGLSALNHFADGGTAPDWQSGTKPENTLTEGYGNMDIDNDLDVIALGSRGSNDFGVYIVDISNPADPLISVGIDTPDRIDDVAFDAAGNLYFVSRGSERLKMFSPGGDSIVSTGSDGSFIRDLTIDFAVATAIVGDLDGDGFVGITDLNLVLSSWNATVTPGDPADPTGDNFVGIEDLNVVLGNWNGGTPPAATVPEPATLALLSMGGVALLRRRR